MVIALSSTVVDNSWHSQWFLCSLVFSIVIHTGRAHSSPIAHLSRVGFAFGSSPCVRAAPACGGCRAVEASIAMVQGNRRGSSSLAEAHDPGPGTCTRSHEGHVNRDLGRTAKERGGVLLRLRTFCLKFSNCSWMMILTYIVLPFSDNVASFFRLLRSFRIKVI